MIIGIGIDIIEVERIKKVFEKRDKKFLEKIFTKSELKYSYSFKNPFVHIAARFCSKEAYYKSIGEGVLHFNEIEVLNYPTGKPFVNLYGNTLDQWEKLGSPLIHVSLSHTETMASAVICLEINNPSHK